jgi:hypothetical protein
MGLFKSVYECIVRSLTPFSVVQMGGERQLPVKVCGFPDSKSAHMHLRTCMNLCKSWRVLKLVTGFDFKETARSLMAQNSFDIAPSRGRNT